MAENMQEELNSYRHQLQLKPIPKLSYKHPSTDQLISQAKPVVITDSNLVASASKWNLEYLNDSLGDGDFSVYLSNNNKFMYWDNQKARELKNFTPATSKTTMKFNEFVKKMKYNRDNGGQRMYLQQPLNDRVGDAIVQDFLSFNWNWVTSQQKRNNWGPLTSNLLLVGMEGNITPAHYDEQENIFCQIHGRKRCILFAPNQFDSLYPYPVFHPHDRQSQVDFDNVDLKSFPKFNQLKGEETILEPGEVLYIPMYWWHDIESLTESGPTVSINFWYKAGTVSTVEYPLKPEQKVAMMRNIEKMVTEALNDKAEVQPFMQSLVMGRYDSSTHWC
ncbi:hypoxia-inducible factor 1-alpha inhibitor-like [Tubulanus polymorphus]|uniref:hypoxia-inducible factor 1-alpha inhibitor-like n=1 Tax=Tubulanus polymorphus TaxID=672921 RepID=UPI003DA528B1